MLCFCTSAIALAADQREPIRLSYTAGAGCPSSSDFEAAVLERSSRARPAGTQEIAREYRVAMRQQQGKSVARLEFAAAGGGTITREVAADQCAEAVRAIALVTALAFDAAVAGASAEGLPAHVQAGSEHAGSEAGSGQPPSSAQSGSVTGSSATPARTAPAKPAPDTAVPTREAAARPEPQRDRPPLSTRADASSKPQFGLGARATGTYAKAPSVLPGGELFALLSGPRLTWLLQVGLAGERGWRLDAGLGQARFSFVGGRLEGCYWGAAIGQAIELRPCASFEGGALIAEGFIEAPRTVVEPWFALGLNARLTWDLGWSAVLFDAGPVLPLRQQDRLVFGSVENERQEVHDVPPIGAFASLGLSFGVP